MEQSAHVTPNAEAHPARGVTVALPAAERAPRGVARGVTARAVLLAFVLTPLNIFFGVSALWRVGTVTGRHSLFPNTVALLFLLAVINIYLRRKCPRWAFSAGEMITIYSVLGIGTGLTGSAWDLGGELAGIITYPFWFATPQNGWKDLLWPNLPTWLTVTDRSALEGFYVGNAHPYTMEVLRAWAAPAFWWALLIGTLMWVCLCLNSLLRPRWADEEKLPFPMTVLPVALADEGSALLYNHLFWIGTALAAAILIWNTLAQVFPALPAIPLAAAFWTTVANHHPWDLIRIPAFQWSPWLLGLCYLMPQEMALSLLAFDFLWEGPIRGRRSARLVYESVVRVPLR